MTRTIQSHKVNAANDAIGITADERDEKNGNASHLYHLSLQFNPSDIGAGKPATMTIAIPFQHGPIKEAGVNGFTNEALLAVIIDRMQGFQSGPYACRENALALTKLEEAKHWLLARTLERVQRGVEGTHQK